MAGHSSKEPSPQIWHSDWNDYRESRDQGEVLLGDLRDYINKIKELTKSGIKQSFD